MHLPNSSPKPALALVYSILSLSILPGIGAQIAGSDFSDTIGFNDPGDATNLDNTNTDDLSVSDGISVTQWTGAFTGYDGNAQAGMANSPVTKIDGNTNDPIPVVGTLPAGLAEISFSINIPAGISVDLTSVTWDWRNATGGGAQRWLAFRTSLDANIIFSELGQARNAVDNETITLDDVNYLGLSNQTVTFYWYAGGEGSGDIDFDTVIINADLTLPDSDGDLLPDVWEQQIIDADPGDGIATVHDVLPADDFDMDNSTNQQEFDRETDPTDPDSDNDDLLDGHETDDGNFQSATQTGTDPKNADSDGDGIEDGDEVNGTAPNNPNAYITNPNLADTDGDFYTDDAEFALGTNPTDIASFPEGGGILFIGLDADPIAGADADVMAFLENRYGADNVTYMQASATNGGDEFPFDTLIISSTIGSDAGRWKFQDSPVPIVNWEEALADNGGGEFLVTGGRTKEGAPSHTITITQDHPITTGFSVGQEVVIADTQTEVWWSTGDQAPGSLSMAEKTGDPASGFITIVDQGGELNDGTIAQGRRVMFGLTDGSFSNFTDDGKTLFGQAIDWALGFSLADAAMQITDISYTRTTAPDNIIIDITFTSQEGKDYTIYRSDDFDTPVESRGDVRDDIPGAVGETSTTVTVDFNNESIPLDTARQFFVVKENQPPQNP